MGKLSAADIASKVQGLYKPKDKSRDIIGTGSTLKRPTKPEDFILADPEHPWCKLTGLLGLPWDIILQIAGAPDSGKSTMAGQFMAWAQKQGYYVVLWDTEKKFDKVRFKKYFGGNPDDINIVATTIIRKGAGAMFKYVRTIFSEDPNAKILLVHDSVGGSVSRTRAEREMDDEKNPQPGSEAVENSDYMRHVVATFDKYEGRIALLLINQMTQKIGGMSKGKSRTGGEKISFHSSMIIEMTRIQDITKTVNKVKVKEGIISRAKIAKNHLSQSELSVYEMRIKCTAKGWEELSATDSAAVEPDDAQESGD
jgi:RecA/RadA recombinase